MNSRRECLVFLGHSKGHFKRVVFKAGETAARSNYVISADANIVGDWWSQHLNDSDDLDTSAVELDKMSSDIIALVLVSLDFK